MGEDVLEGAEEGQEVSLEHIHYLDLDTTHGGHLARTGGSVIHPVTSKPQN